MLHCAIAWVLLILLQFHAYIIHTNDDVVIKKMLSTTIYITQRKLIIILGS